MKISPYQHREWVLWRLAEGRSGKVVASARKLAGNPDEEFIRGRLADAVRNHPILRLAFGSEEPTATVRPDAVVPLALRYAGPEEMLAEAVARVSRELARDPFDLTTAPVLRAILVRAGFGETPETALVLGGHPIIADEASLERILEEIDSSSNEEILTIDEAFFNWIDSAVESEDGESVEPKLAFYRQVLDGAAFQLDLPTDRIRPPVFTGEGDRIVLAIPQEVQRAVEALAAAESTRPAVLVLTALAEILRRLSRQTDIVLGVATDLRPSGLEAAVGPFENKTVLRVRLEDSPSGKMLVEQIQQGLTALEPYRGLPFETLARALQPEPDPSRPPVYQVQFAHRTGPEPLERLAAPTGQVDSDLEIIFEQYGTTLRLGLGYRTDIFERDTIRGLGLQIIELLRGLGAYPDRAMAALPVCTPRERDWILKTLGVQKDFPAEDTIHGLVAAAAARHPEATAVCCGEGKLSYGELNRRANRLAHRLRQSGVGRDVPVAVCLERSEELIIALLAILKAGGAYVPIEPANPEERIDFVLTDSRAKLVLTDPFLREKVVASPVPSLVLEPGGFDLASESDADPVETTGPDGLAYIIYTSGSTGRPKGVLIEHRQVVRLFRATEEWFHFDSNDVWTLFHSAAFDFSVWEIWGALIYGGRLVVVPYLLSRSPGAFFELLAREQVTVLNQTPSAFRQLIRAENEEGVRDLALRLVIFGGEALEFESLRPWFDRHGDRRPRLVNMYGITETCVHVTYRPVFQADLDRGRGASIIGIPIPDLSAFVVDENLQLLPSGIPGELVVGGAGLGRGYLERPELTAERFIPDPFSNRPHSRLYRSGDLVRLLPTGELDYLGRIDQQVKIRGFRIETGEIEAVLRRTGMVRDVAVVPWQPDPEETLLAAYVVSDRPPGELREAVRTVLPEYMVPAFFVTVPAIPMTANGKLDQKALPPPRPVGPRETAPPKAPASELERIIAEVWCEVLGIAQVSVRESFFNLGGTSLKVVRAASKLKERLHRPIEVVKIFQYPSVSALARHLDQAGVALIPAKADRGEYRSLGMADEPIAIVGMAGRFPGANDLESLWDLLIQGREGITFFSDADLDPALREDPAYVKARGILEGADLFDPAFFDMSPLEAEITDPQQRVLLELAWEALEHAGCNPADFPGLIAVYAGVYNDTYYLENVLKRPDMVARAGAFQAMLGNEKDFVATRIAHRLDLKGPAVSLHTACSTSLVAIAEAYYALRNRRCDLALAGGAAVTCPQRSGYQYQEGGMLSADGHTRPFDEKASGTVFSDGAAMVVLRRLSEALADGDTVYGVIRGAATNNDGGNKMSFSAPTVEGQAEVVRRALAVAGVDPLTIGYLEAHGTATPMGDPIEVEALRQAFGAHNGRKGFCALGSVKSNLGHMTAAAGVTGFIKTTLALDREMIPSSLGFVRPNPELRLEDSPFYVPSRLQPWPRQPDKPRRGGVSSFGVGGTNAHIVLEEGPRPSTGGSSRKQQLLVLSAKTESALQAKAADLSNFLDTHPTVDLADAAFTLQRGRKPFAHRRALPASTREEAVARLRSPEAAFDCTGKAPKDEPQVVFLFPGQGAQHLNMGRGLYETEGVFRDAVDRCAEILQQHLDLDLRRVLYPNGAETTGEENQINQTWLAQPAIFTVEYALARLWMSWGVMPAVLIGHSIGEYVAAVLAEAFTLEDALALLSVRARLMQALPAGSMLAIRLGAGEVEGLLPNGASLAAENSPTLCVVSGPTDLIEGFQQELEAKGIVARVLHTSHAFHSAMMDPMLPEFAVAARQAPVRPPKISWLSTCNGSWMTPEDLADGQYWVKQVRQTVRFAQALEQVIEAPNNLMLEVGPGQTLTQIVRQQAKKPKSLAVVPTLGPVGNNDRGDLAWMLAGLGRMWVAGLPVDWKGFWAEEKRRRVALPTYPFERKRCWIDPPVMEEQPMKVANPAALQAALYLKEVEEPEISTVSMPEMTAVPSRKERLINDLRELFQNYSGTDHSQTDEKETFLDLGMDSLLLTQVSQGIVKRFGVKVTFRQLLGDLSTLSLLAAFLDEKLPPEAVPQPVRQTIPPAAKTVIAAAEPRLSVVAPGPRSTPLAGSGGLVETVIQQQMAIMNQQLDLLRQTVGGGGTPAASPLPQAIPSPSPTSQGPVVTAVNLDQHSHFGPFKPIEKGAAGGLTERQQAAMDRLVARYNRRTAKSKALAQQHRAYFCDPRAAGNFRQLWKEMVYPIACAKSKGSRIWDIDGNEYVDVTMGFGANYLGHSPDFVMEALKEQMRLGIEIGPQSPIAGEVARMICEFTGMERATFCNTGSEAVMAAIRVARTVTGREKIVYFYGDYHGIFDEVLGRPALIDGLPGAMPIAPGIPHLAQVMILEYGSPAALETIRRHADEIAVVLVEPVQSRHPDLQPREFLKDLRRLTEEKEIALVFDEVITGFRVAPGGAQEYFGVKADLATYGKVVGGGMPIGVLAGSAAYMDALDGGFWQYGDESSPPTGVTFFAGTFVRHPLTMAAAQAVLKYLKKAGPALQEQTNRRTARLVDRVNAFFQGRHLPMRLQIFSSVFFYDFHADLKFAGLLFYYLRDRGIHIWEGRVGTLSIAHTDRDMDLVLEAFQASVEEMQLGGFLPEGGTGIDSKRPGDSGDFTVKPAGESSDLDRPSTGEAFAADPNRFPLSEEQREMWLGAQMRPEAAGPHHACTGLYLEGDLNLEALRQAIRSVMERHEGLRCSFHSEGTEVLLHPMEDFELTLEDLSALPESERESRVNKILEEEGRRLFDLESWPLVAFRILKLSGQRHFLILTAQMIVCDGWSHYVVFEDLGAIYSALAEGSQPSLEPPVPMREYALWQQSHQGTEEDGQSEAFWLSCFRTIPPPIDLPTSRSRKPGRTFEGDRRNLVLSKELYRAIKKLAKEQKNSYFSVLLATFNVWLHRLSGGIDLVVGVPFAGQGLLGLDRLIGQCAHILPLRTTIDPEETFTSLLGRTWSTLLDAQEHWDFGYGRLIPKLDLPRDPSRIPLVSVLFNIDPPMTKVGFAGLNHRFVTGPRYYFQYDLGFNLVETEDTILVECDYNPNLFEGDTIRSWTRCYQNLLEAVVADPGQPVGRLPMLDEQEVERLQGSGSQAISVEVPDQTIQELVFAQAHGTPLSKAIICDGFSLTYGDLEERSNRLANYLKAHGAGSGMKIGVCLDRSVDLPVALLGILKSDAVYVAIEPFWPGQRIGEVLRETEISMLLVNRTTEAGLPETPVRVLRLDEEAQAIALASAENPGIPGGADRVACILYTSGSTGRPKAVEITQGAMANFILAMQRGLGIGPGDVFLNFSPFSLAGSIFEIWLPLALGARTVMAPTLLPEDPKAFEKTLSENGITIMQATPTVWGRLVNEGWPGQERLKALCGGETLGPSLAERLTGLCGEVWHAYGATETAGWSLIRRIKAGDSIVLGDPRYRTRIALVDDYLEPVPVGVPGEIMVQSSGLARGYHNQPERTKEKFIDYTIKGAVPGRTYRTGDMARYRPDGQIEFIGHRDLQVMVQGFRVELGEIETVIQSHPMVREAAVSLRENNGADPVLGAYFSAHPVQAGEEATDTDKLARELRQLARIELPEYMVPAVYVRLGSLPLTSGGKIDRTNLPAPSKDDMLVDDLMAPRDETEDILVRIWKDILKLETLGVQDSFFDLGGQSLMAVKMFNRIEQEFGRKLPLATLFRYPTIEQLAGILKDKTVSESSSGWPSLIPIQPKGSKTPLFLVHGAGGNVLLYRALAERLGPDYPLYGLQSQGLDGQSKPLKTIEEMAEHYLKEIKSVQPRGPYLFGGYCLGGTVAYEMAQRLVAHGEKVPLVAMLDTYNFRQALKATFAFFLLQKFLFHLRNFIRLRPRTMLRYLREKKRIAGDGGWAHIRTEMPGSTLQSGVARAESGIEASVQEINDHAGDIYEPKPYPGVVTLFKPQVNYKFYPDPKMGWGDLALKGLDIVEFPINPHAMLVEPYVEMLAKELKIRLDRAVQ
jgi:amino acid adenylation domain-containing protein